MRLPVELLDHTIKYLPRPSQTEEAKDLKACALVSRHLNATCRPLLFATIELGPEVPLTALAHIRPVTRGVITTLRFDLADACRAWTHAVVPHSRICKTLRKVCPIDTVPRRHDAFDELSIHKPPDGFDESLAGEILAHFNATTTYQMQCSRG
jgi:hypothetical protein